MPTSTVLIAGLAITITAIAAGHGVLLLTGSVVAGAGFGSAFLGAFRTLVVAAGPARRGELIAALYVAAYLALVRKRFGEPALDFINGLLKIKLRRKLLEPATA